ncbi:ABC transporter substrate-binding protein [Deinococcus soli (ex Cha et al. 2016)]|uniref:Thiamine pyrimidine synthase n=2 Tax=Deinococcus soli (ex Cha et al. 2016) TaxID=1309411 RepID=A0AAE3XB02_9DEIO|nr:ABC transporter substrate-binding protein [Deinococcus soli (ex Cha et al. 2016)]MDR6217771.1 NitT/TauT family transport system substrate-binding protein [Deinococcus soli (ex Cha et al. 2016)]MDR6328021.1 NitT/TauT family transport system substrate-binding protein [Deinococcus soli (ex Cha et al. 2016)]MDR6750873.1 NitT/TauT family transport system substrate-binding protein [Deinococcus soli (ex Cha et al. 2016)]
MKRSTIILATLLLAVTGTASAQKLVPVKVQLKWFPQAQFAGFFVAQAKGYYKAEGLDVQFLPTGDQSPIQTVATGTADFGTTWITDLLTARQQGIPVVHIAQLFQKSGYTLVALNSSGIKTPADFKGKRVGVWPSGNEYPAVALLKKYGLTTSLDSSVSNPSVQAVTYPFDPSIVFPDKVDLVSAMTYNEVDQIVGLGYPLDKLKIFNASDYGINLLEDLMFTTERTLANRNFKGSGMSGEDIAAKLVRATLKGWNYAVKNQKEAVQIVLVNCGNTCKGSGTRSSAASHQTWQMAEVAKLYNAGPTLKGRAGYLDPATYKANVTLLKSLGILKADPAPAAVTYKVWEKATGKK